MSKRRAQRSRRARQWHTTRVSCSGSCLTAQRGVGMADRGRGARAGRSWSTRYVPSPPCTAAPCCWPSGPAALGGASVAVVVGGAVAAVACVVAVGRGVGDGVGAVGLGVWRCVPRRTAGVTPMRWSHDIRPASEAISRGMAGSGGQGQEQRHEGGGDGRATRHASLHAAFGSAWPLLGARQRRLPRALARARAEC